jgi:hypothetical protein
MRRCVRFVIHVSIFPGVHFTRLKFAMSPSFHLSMCQGGYIFSPARVSRHSLVSHVLSVLRVLHVSMCQRQCVDLSVRPNHQCGPNMNIIVLEPGGLGILQQLFHLHAFSP